MDDNAPVNPENPAPSTPPPVLPPSAPPPFRVPPPVIPMAPAAQPPPPRKSRGWMIVALVTICMLGVSMLINLGHFLHGFGAGPQIKGMSHVAGRAYQEHLIEDNKSDDKFAVIEVQGVISSQMMEGGQNMVTQIKDQLSMAADDDAVKAVILKVDSPGGEVLAADDIARALVDFHSKSSKPIIVAMEGLAASGGYYVSAPCQWIVANELTITGSIGVIMESYNYRGLMNKVGVQPMVFKSGKFKDMLSGEKMPEEISAEEKQMVQVLIDETFAKFKQVISEGRQKAEAANKKGDKGRSLASDWRDYADGRIFSGRQAYELGFVDELGSFEVAVKRATKMTGVDSANLVRYQQPFDITSLFSLFGKSEARSIKLDLGLERPKLQVGRLYFMSSSVLH
jgi:protease-4